MFKSLSSSNNSRKLHAQLESLTFSRELTSQADVTFNTTPYPNGGDIIGYDGEIACISYDAVQSLLAVSTKSGRITLYADFGRLPRLTWALKPAIAIHHLLLKAGTSYLLAVGELIRSFNTPELMLIEEICTLYRRQRHPSPLRLCRPRRAWRTQAPALAFYAVKSEVSSRATISHLIPWLNCLMHAHFLQLHRKHTFPITHLRSLPRWMRRYFRRR